MKIDFEKTDEGRWYVVMDNYEGDHEDLEMVDGADELLDVITMDNMTASINVYEDEPDIDDYYTLTLIEHDEIGATYQVESYPFYNGTIWLCNVAHLFLKEHPEKLYFTLSDVLD